MLTAHQFDKGKDCMQDWLRNCQVHQTQCQYLSKLLFLAPKAFLHFLHLVYFFIFFNFLGGDWGFDFIFTAADSLSHNSKLSMFRLIPSSTLE